jgi:hypothetical protein
MHGTLPPYVERDILSFVLFYVSPLQFYFDSKTGKVVRCTTQHFITNSTGTLMSMIWLSFCLGLMIHVDFELFPRRPVTMFWDLFYWRNILNNYVMACKWKSVSWNSAKSKSSVLTARVLLHLFSRLRPTGKMPRGWYSHGWGSDRACDGEHGHKGQQQPVDTIYEPERLLGEKVSCPSYGQGVRLFRSPLLSSWIHLKMERSRPHCIEGRLLVLLLCIVNVHEKNMCRLMLSCRTYGFLCRYPAHSIDRVGFTSR